MAARGSMGSTALLAVNVQSRVEMLGLRMTEIQKWNLMFQQSILDLWFVSWFNFPQKINFEWLVVIDTDWVGILYSCDFVYICVCEMNIYIVYIISHLH